MGSSPTLGTSNNPGISNNTPQYLPENGKQLVSNFLKSRREGLSTNTIDFYDGYLRLSNSVIGVHITGQDIARFLDNLECSNGGKHAYYRVLRAFYNWVYSRKSGYNLNPQDNPILAVDAPKVGKRVLPSLTPEQLDLLIDQAECSRDKAIISLFADSGLRLSELANINRHNIDWQNRLIKVICKGNKEGYAPFGSKTQKLLSEWLTQCPTSDKLWDISEWGIAWMLRKLANKTGLPCNAHSFRRGFACHLHKKGLSTLSIMNLGRWSSLDMVTRYTRSITFDDCLELYKQANKS